MSGLGMDNNGTFLGCPSYSKRQTPAPEAAQSPPAWNFLVLVRPQAEKQTPCCFLTGLVFVSLGAQAHPVTQRSVLPTPPFVTVSPGSNYIPSS